LPAPRRQAWRNYALFRYDPAPADAIPLALGKLAAAGQNDASITRPESSIRDDSKWKFLVESGPCMKICIIPPIPGRIASDIAEPGRGAAALPRAMQKQCFSLIVICD